MSHSSFASTAGALFVGKPGFVRYLDHFREDDVVHEKARCFAQKALETFSDDSGKEYELVDILLFDWSWVLDYHVYFSAKQKDAPEDDADAVKTFRAIVQTNATEIVTVKECVVKTPYRTLPAANI